MTTTTEKLAVAKLDATSIREALDECEAAQDELRRAQWRAREVSEQLAKVVARDHNMTMAMMRQYLNTRSGQLALSRMLSGDWLK